MNQLFGGLERHSVVGFGKGLLLRQLEFFFAKFGDQFESVLELALTFNLEQYRNSSVLLLCGHIRKVVLGFSQFFGAECDVNVQGTSLCIELSKRRSTNIEGFEVPANAALNTLVGEQEILDSVVVILNAALRLCKTRQITAAITGYKLNLSATLLVEHFCITLCFSNSIDVIQRHGTKSTEGFLFVILRLFGFGSGLCNNLGSNRFFNNLGSNFFNDSFFGSFFNNFFNNFFNGFFNNLFVLN